jgi:hypothetical protein
VPVDAGEAVSAAVPVPVDAGVPVPVDAGVGVCAAVPVPVDAGEAVSAAVPVPVDAGVAAAAPVPVGVSVRVAVVVRVGVPVGEPATAACGTVSDSVEYESYTNTTMAYAVTVPPAAGGVHAHVTDDLSVLDACVTPPAHRSCDSAVASVGARLPALALEKDDGGDAPGNVAAMKPRKV